MKTISYGGGVQSTAMLVLAIQGKIPGVEAALFANVGDDSEHPATLRYVREISKPWAEAQGLPVHELQWIKRDGTVETLYERLTGESNRIPIPVRGENGAPMRRSCTADFKIRVIGKWLKQHGATADNPATVCIGISTDEYLRVGNKKVMPYEQPIYPLIDLGLSRQDCMQVIAKAGLPVPPKSACYFCPFHRNLTWAEMRRDEPELFEKSAQIEDQINAKQEKLGRRHYFMTGEGVPLREAIHEAQDMLPLQSMQNGGQCDDGYCWT